MPQTIADIVSQHRAGKPVTDTLRETYAAIRAWNDPALFITLRDEADALAAAQTLDATRNKDLPLFGIPFAVKDNIDVAGLPTTAACEAFAHTPEASAHVVERLVAAGAIPIGKTNLDQFATGLVGIRSPYGTPRNARDPDLIPGGSSSGSASAVAAGLVPFALGTDTAGSGRVPAALQGIVGLKPTLGAISTRGVVPACRTLDCVSIFAATVWDAQQVYAMAAGFDPADPFAKAATLVIAPPAPFDGVRVGVPRPEDRLFFGDAQAEAAFDAALADLAARGAILTEIDMTPLTDTARLLYEGPWVAERYAATRPLIETAPEALHPVTRTIIEGASRFDAVSAFEGLYRLAALKRRAEPIWTDIDLLVVPTIPTLYTKAQVEADPIRLNSHLGTYTNFVNLLDLCALAVPTAPRADGRPAGITLIAPAGQDGYLASLGLTLDGSTGMSPRPFTAGRLQIAVVGAHLTGLPLNRQLTDLDGQFIRADATSDAYRFVRLAGGPPLRPGLVKGAPGSGRSIALEIWSLPLANVGLFLAQIPFPLGLGSIELADGSTVNGFICEAGGLEGATDITQHGGWRNYLATLA